MLTAVLCMSFGVTLTAFAGFHLWLVARNDSTIEMGQRDDDEQNQCVGVATKSRCTCLCPAFM